MRVFLTNLLKNKQKMPRFSQNSLDIHRIKTIKDTANNSKDVANNLKRKNLFRGIPLKRSFYLDPIGSTIYKKYNIIYT